MDLPELIVEAKKGNARAQKSIYEKYAEKMLLLCGRYVKKREDAEELLLNGFYIFFQKFESFNYSSEGALISWLKRIMINECLMFLRKQKVFNMVTESEAEEVVIEEKALNNLSAAELFDLIRQLPVGYKTVFNLYEIEGFSHKEIAGVMNVFGSIHSGRDNGIEK